MRGLRLLALLVTGYWSLITSFAQNPVHVTYLWHMHQPVYYPYESVNATDGAGRYNFSVAGVHNERTGPYTSWPKNAVQQGADRGMPHAGVQVSFSGSLGENLNGLWGSGWPGDYRWARNNLRTSLNNPRLDTVGIAYHHSLMPLTSYESMRMQIKLHKEIYKELWDTQGYSKGFWPPECAFSENMIPALVDEGLEWVLVDNGHFDRACQNYPWVNATSIRPNPSDQINPDPTTLGSQWVQLNNVWAPSKVSAPWGYQPHKVKYVNPATGAEQKMTAVPAARYEGNENGRGGYGAFKPENVWGTHVNNGVNNNAQRPMLIVCHSDGDNYGMLNADAYNGQHGNFLTMVQNDARFDHSSVQDYLDMYPVPDNDLIHVEPGSWIGIDGGTPYFDKWVENNPGFRGDPNEHPDMWSWSMIVAAQNRVIHADRLENSYSMNDVQWGIGADTAKAWHFYLQAETSCHWYWDYDRANPWDGNTTRGCNLAVAEANKVIARHGNDPMGPSIFPPQRTIWNPGGKHWNETTNQPTTFQVWSFIHDASGIAAARVWVRQDNDGSNPISENDNEVFAHNSSKVGAWTQIAMSSNWYPAGKGPMVPDPAARAMKYQATVSGYNNALLDYYVEAVDTAGNTNRSEIKHVWVGESGVVNPVTFQPSIPDNCPGSTLRIAYNSAGRNLSAANPVTASVRYVGAVSSNDLVMSGTVGGLWSVTSAIPSGASSAIVTFKNGGTTDDNSGATWTIGIATCTVPASVSFDPPAPNGCVPVTITYSPNDGPLKTSNPVKIHVGYNGWQGVIAPDPVMTATGSSWTYTYQPPAGATEINCVFNNGGATWDNNNGQDYGVAVSNCTLTNAVVTFSPGVPRQCDPLVITYNPAGRALISINPVYIFTRANGEGGSPIQYQMFPQGSNWVFTNSTLGSVTNLQVYFGSSGGGVVDDNGGATWLVAVSSCNSNGPAVASWSPQLPNGCVPVTLTYRPNNGPLATAATVRVHVGYDGWVGAASLIMTQQVDGSWQYVYNTPVGASQINLCFNDGGSTWDNNATQDWLINVTGCGVPADIRFAVGSPQISQGGTNTQNQRFESFIFSQAGGYASTSNQGGFGSFGRVYLNYDANNFYIGAEGVEMVGSNNALVIFIEVNTLGDNVNNLWNQGGLPQGLDHLHNVWLNQKADLALVVGDEWGDGQFPSFGLGNGYDMGQGAWYLSATSFWPVAGFNLAQFDGTGSTATFSTDDDGNRLTDRWQASIPWASMGSTNGIDGITNMWLYGLVVSDGTNGNNRYISGNYLGKSVTPPTNGNYGFTFVTLDGIKVGLPTPDANNNGIPDAWEMEHFGSLGVINDSSDWDQDGQPDRAEYWSGTHPKNAQSHLRATQVMQAPGPGGFVVRWFSVSNKVYELHRATDLLSGAFVPVQTNLTATPSENSYTDTTVNAGAVIYRVISR